MAACKLKKGDRIYECRYHESILTELLTDPELLVQGENSHYWHWKAKIIETNSRHVVPGEIIQYGITEEAPGHGFVYSEKEKQFRPIGYDSVTRWILEKML